MLLRVNQRIFKFDFEPVLRKRGQLGIRDWARIFDVDGVLTDSTITITTSGELLRKMNVKVQCATCRWGGGGRRGGRGASRWRRCGAGGRRCPARARRRSTIWGRSCVWFHHRMGTRSGVMSTFCSTFCFCVAMWRPGALFALFRRAV